VRIFSLAGEKGREEGREGGRERQTNIPSGVGVEPNRSSSSI